jgi:general secretion pathway protein E
VVELERALFREAIRRGASDIHIDPGDRSSRVRYRVDGRLIDGFGLPRWLHDRIVARFKVMARLDISERSLPQDGHLSDPAEGFEARLSTLPTYRGEAVVLRLFGDRGEAPSLARIGCGPEVRHQLLAISQRRQGVLLVAGPTGSGKTTTLYAILHELLREPLNIVTIEDPVEYRVEGIRQVQVDERRNRTFQTALRSTLRQDPDVILVGEIRDAETARIAFHAGLTGHLVLSTLHAREAVATLVRLSELGVDRGVIASTLIGVVAQRLPPRSCPGCRAPDDAPEYLADRLGIPTAARSGLSRPRGCIDCGFSGTRGRLPIFEILEPDRHLPGEPLPEGDLELRRLAIGSGFVPMIEAALPLALAGEMTLEEAYRACYFGGSR